MKLTIAIPTYNRARRLDKTLIDLLEFITKSNSRQQISVLVSNNGSLDNTDAIIAENSRLFESSRIPFLSIKFSQNQGFDANVLACYKESNTDYVWFLSDDDNINPGAIDTIVSDIENYAPTVIFYNFDQKPYDVNNPYNKTAKVFEAITRDNLSSLSKIICWPKLSALVVKRIPVGLLVLDDKSGFAHVGLAMQCGIMEGKVLHSPVFTTYPDSDYQDNIDFPPYIGNNLNIVIHQVLTLTDRMDLFKHLAVKKCDPLTSSFNTLGAFYRGKNVLTPALRDELLNTIKCELLRVKFEKVSDLNFHKESIKFILSILYCIGYTIFTQKKPMRLRPNYSNRK
jgi:glycosyltransferase involved in cell wall biosynthesis